MNILHVFGTRPALEHWLLSETLVSADYSRSIANGKGHVQAGAVRFACIVITNVHDVEFHRGQRFDIIMFHDSFTRNLFELSGGVLERIREFLYANCLRR